MQAATSQVRLLLQAMQEPWLQVILLEMLLAFLKSHKHLEATKDPRWIQQRLAYSS
jgi:hypothetical protein